MSTSSATSVVLAATLLTLGMPSALASQYRVPSSPINVSDGSDKVLSDYERDSLADGLRMLTPSPEKVVFRALRHGREKLVICGQIALLGAEDFRTFYLEGHRNHQIRFGPGDSGAGSLADFHDLARLQEEMSFVSACGPSP
jgi:hypothetical protein